MIAKEDLEKLIRERIESEEKLGEQAGGSGHMGYVDYHIDSIDEPVRTGEGYSVTYSYTLVITTEFTYEPDNPPYRVPVTKTILIGKDVFDGQA
jgi:hypothetical protein